MRTLSIDLLTCLIVVSAGICFSHIRAQDRSGKPNIIIILADDLGWGDVGFHGSEIMTPNLDQLAEEGVVLSHFYTAPVCSPTRAGLMTGKYPNRFGLRQTVIPPWSEFGVDPDEKFLPQYLEQSGYVNRAVLGKWHLGHAKKEYLPLSRGFTRFYGHYNGAIDYFTHKREGELDWHNDWDTSFDKGYSTDLISDEAVKCIRDYTGSPFLMYVAYNAPHGPLQAKKEDMLLYGYDENQPKIGRNKGEGSQGKGNTARQTYAAMVTCMDRGIGRIMKALKEQGIEENTLVLFFSDNGAAPGEGGSSGKLRGTKFQEWDGGVRSPAIVKWPAGFEGGRTVDQVTGYIDVLPTLLEVCRHEEGGTGLDGINILPVLKGQKSTVERDFYLGYGSLVNNSWKLVRANAGNARMKHKEDALFRIMQDPYEQHSVKEKQPQVYENLLRIVKEYDAIKPGKSVPPYGQGRKGFKAPENWKVTR
ncbi:arylsulfatase B [Sinomicrobium soli]|uniref:arylsulfatase B n=1 Tax=Sinomicrobium sp. N-1-3-6 TaxID=2219864 RepID=UPI000DCB6136|nr:arylsulfatase [Sinomicrobium sp. N-1-3-6]RAV30258.1 arylsulfatase [Sinomicrobium sp. N-1-3-6]